MVGFEVKRWPAGELGVGVGLWSRGQTAGISGVVTLEKCFDHTTRSAC